MNAETDLRTALARADLDDATIAHWLDVLRPRLDSTGRYRRSTGQVIGSDQVAALVLASEQAKAAEPPQDAPELPGDPEVFLASMKARMTAQRAKEAAQQPGTISGVLDRMRSPLDGIKP